MSMEKSTKTSVRYNKHTKLWEAYNGKGFEEHKDKRKVLLYALKCDHPEIYRAIKDISFFHRTEDGKVSLRLIDRLIKAAMLIARGHVYGDGVIRSQEGKSFYLVELQGIPKTWKCNCEDFKKGAVACDYGQMCKHTFALMIAGFLQLDLPEFYPGEKAENVSGETEELTELDFYSSRLEQAI